MDPEFTVEALKPKELDAQARQLWTTFRAADPALRSPYFDLRYVLAAGEAAPGAEVAVIRRQGRIEGFLPFQRRGRRIQPIAAPLTDYHGLIQARDGGDIDLTRVVQALGARRFRFSGLVGQALSRARVSVRSAMVADLGEGVDAYLAGRPGDFLKDKRRRARRLAEDHGPLSFSLSEEDDGALDLIFRLKREQMRRTAQLDVFASPWTTQFLRHLTAHSEPDFGPRFAVLKAGGRIVAAELGLRSGDAYHLWFPVYDPDFAKYSPGALMTLETLRAAAEQGIRTIDFGPANEAYKREFATPGIPVFEGDVTTSGLEAATRRAADLALGRDTALRQALSSAGLRLDRRWDRITACDPRLEGQVGKASQTLTDFARRNPQASATVGVGLGLGLGLGIATLLAD
jgi:CelD/BcsL family acetyltransferase involved in cellulose biosynthesis